MRILITNDDGIYAEGLKTLVEFARTLGEVVVCAPKVQQSGTSQGIMFHNSFEIKEVTLEEFPDVRAIAVDSTPADCVRVALAYFKIEPDLILSGINRGLNMGEDIGYSGTAGALFEAAYSHIPALALSTDVGSYEDARKNLPRVFEYVKERKLFDYGPMFNINIPFDPKPEILITRMGGPYYKDWFEVVGDDQYLAHGYCVHVNGGDLTLDTDATISGYITVTPLQISRTNERAYDELRAMSCEL